MDSMSSWEGCSIRSRVLILTQAILLFCLTCTPALADFSGPVVSVLDGDTIEVRHPQATYDKIKDQIVAKQK